MAKNNAAIMAAAIISTASVNGMESEAAVAEGLKIYWPLVRALYESGKLLREELSHE
jgi:hypothetical protein